jgi:hypothetical protein
MADVRFRGDVGVTVQGGVTVRDHRTDVQQQLVARDYRQPRRGWNTPSYVPVVVQQPAPQPNDIRCNDSAWTTIAQANVTGTREQWSSDTIHIRGYRNIGEMTFGWVTGNQSIEDVTVTYMNGTQARFHLGDTVNQSPAYATTRTIALNPNLTIRNVQISGFGGPTGVFSILAKA